VARVSCVSMEGFATGFALSGATRPGFSVENDKFKVSFDGVMCNEVKNIVSHGFESCYDWRPVMSLVLEAASQDYKVLLDIEERAEERMKRWLATFEGWGLLASILPPLKHRYFILSLAYTSANWDVSTGGEHSEEKVFEAVKTVFEAVPGKELNTLVPKFGMWFEELSEGGIEDQRKKQFTIFFNAKWVLEVKFVVEKKREVRSLVGLAAEVVVRRLECKEEVEALEVPRTLLPVVRDKFQDAEWVRKYWQYKAEMWATKDEDSFEELGRLNFQMEEDSFRNFAGKGTLEDRVGEGEDLEREEDEEVVVVDKVDSGGFISVSLWWAFYVLLVFFAYVCS